MKEYDETYSYEISDDGYDIYIMGKKSIVQHEPYIPYPDLGYEESCKKQIEGLIEASKEAEKIESETEKRLSELESQNAELISAFDDILTNVIPAMMAGTTEESEEK